ncbi:MAG: LysM peptidoglycan-binding domain-containing protein [Akkermansia sp.]|nr:LysM peptidoglycan-binding domain-containing protein [Akkermansia sp.]
MSRNFITALPLAAASALSLSSCVIKDGSLDFTWWQDAAAPVMEDDVVIESGGGYYRSTPAPSQIPLASIPRPEPETKPAAPTPAPTPAAAAPTAPGQYVVRPGDTLSSIARRYRTSVSAIVAANGMASANVPLRINQSLRIPSGTATASPAPKPVATAPAAKPAPAPVAAASGNSYTVKAGDTLYRISRQYGVSPTALMQANGLTPTTANTIRVGTTLRIPKVN